MVMRRGACPGAIHTGMRSVFVSLLHFHDVAAYEVEPIGGAGRAAPRCPT